MMDMHELWQKALKKTEIIRTRIRPLKTFAQTEIPYTFLAESALNVGDTVVRKGQVVVEKPAIVLPGNMPQFQGFDFDDEDDVDMNHVIDFLLIRGVKFPSLKYNNRTTTVDVFEGSLQKAIDHHQDILQKQEDVHTALVVGPEDCWQLSVIIFVGAIANRAADDDVRRLLDSYKHN